MSFVWGGGVQKPTHTHTHTHNNNDTNNNSNSHDNNWLLFFFTVALFPRVLPFLSPSVFAARPGFYQLTGLLLFLTAGESVLSTLPSNGGVRGPFDKLPLRFTVQNFSRRESEGGGGGGGQGGGGGANLKPVFFFFFFFFFFCFIFLI